MGTKIVTSIGQSQDSYTLGNTLATEAKAKLRSGPPDLVLVFASKNQNHARLLQGIQKITGDCPMIGSCAGGGFTETDHASDGAVCALIQSDTHRFSIGMGKGVQADVENAVSQATSHLCLETIREHPYRSAMMFMDVEAGRSEETVSAASRMFGADTPIAGGGGVRVFYNGNVYSDVVAFCLIHSKTQPRMAATHGHYPFGDIMTVTKAKERRIYEIDGKNAWEVWKERSRARREDLGFTNDALNDPENREKFFLFFGLGVMTDENLYKMRAVIKSYPDGSLKCSPQVPEGSKFRMTCSDRASQLAAVERAAKLARIYKAKKAAGAIIFDCEGRSSILGKEYYTSIKAFNNVLEGTPFIGFETFGEICTGSVQLRGFLHTACVMVIFPD